METPHRAERAGHMACARVGFRGAAANISRCRINSADTPSLAIFSLRQPPGFLRWSTPRCAGPDRRLSVCRVSFSLCSLRSLLVSLVLHFEVPLSDQD